MVKSKEIRKITIRAWVTKKAGRYASDSFKHGEGVVYRYFPIKERQNLASLWKRLSRIASKYDGEGYFFYGKLSYGWLEDNFGKISEFYNDGEYRSSKELLESMKIWSAPQEVEHIWRITK